MSDTPDTAMRHADAEAMLANEAVIATLLPHPSNLQFAWNSLTDDERFIWRRFYGLDGQPRWASPQIARHLGILRSTVENIRCGVPDRLQELMRPTHQLTGLSNRTKNFLLREGIRTPHDLRACIGQVAGRRGFGKGMLIEVDQWLIAQDLSPVSTEVPQKLWRKFSLVSNE